MNIHGSFRYYLPGLVLDGSGKVTRQHVEERGLWDRLDDCVTGQIATEKFSTNGVTRGPDGRGGVLIVPMPHDGGTVARTEYAPEHQTWIKSDRGDYWIGIDKDHPPTPGGMVRRHVVDGYSETLGDGQQWVCPTVRTEILQARVPMTYGLVGDSLIGQVQPRYVTVWKQSMQWAVRFLEDFQNERIVDLLGGVEAFKACVACLAINYRIGVEEATLLRILDDSAMEKIIDAAIDMPTFRDIHGPGGDVKKKESWQRLLDDWQSSLRGSGGSTPDTPPAGPTSN